MLKDKKKSPMKKGQSTLEYIILVTGVVVVIVAFIMGTNSPFKSAMNSTLNEATGAMVSMGGKIEGVMMNTTVAE